MAQQAQQSRVSELEYLSAERAAETKHELWHGVIFAMAGASPRHNALAMEVGVLLRTRLGSGGCRPFGSDQRVHIPASGNYCYPDITVVCGDLDYHSADPDSVLNPQVIVEVLSASTEAHDRGAKFDDYRSIPSLQEYVLVSQDRVRVQVFHRNDLPEGSWTVTFFGEGDDVLLRSLDVELPVAELYAGAFDLRGDEPRAVATS